MEYRKDKRTKNLTLREIHIGDWVQEWSPIPEKYSPPMKVSCINYDGTVYLVPDDEHYCDPVETEIENVDALPIDADLLRGFGFEQIRDKDAYRYYHNNDFFYSVYDCGLHVNNPLFYFSTIYFHELQNALAKYFDINFKWKGVRK